MSNKPSDPTASSLTSAQAPDQQAVQVFSNGAMPTVDGPDVPHAPAEARTTGYVPSGGAELPDNGAATIVGNYELLGQLGSGGMGVVYRARHRKLNRLVALKVTRIGPLAAEEGSRRFQAEAEAAARLDHPHIVPIYEFGEVDGQCYYSMALVDGQSLAQHVAERPLAPRQAAALLQTVAEAVAYAHSQGVIHRDLKSGTPGDSGAAGWSRRKGDALVPAKPGRGWAVDWHHRPVLDGVRAGVVELLAGGARLQRRSDAAEGGELGP